MARRRLGELLLEAGLVDAAQLRAALAEHHTRDKPLGRALVDLDLVREDALIRVLGQQLQMPVAPLGRVKPDAKALAMLEEDYCERNECVPLRFEERGRFLDVAMADPTNQQLYDEIRVRSRCNIRPYIAGPRAISTVLRRVYGRDTRQDWTPVVVGEALFDVGGEPQIDLSSGAEEQAAGPQPARGLQSGKSIEVAIDLDDHLGSGSSMPAGGSLDALSAAVANVAQTPSGSHPSQSPSGTHARVSEPDEGLTELRHEIAQLKATLRQTVERVEQLEMGMAIQRAQQARSGATETPAAAVPPGTPIATAPAEAPPDPALIVSLPTGEQPAVAPTEEPTPTPSTVNAEMPDRDQVSLSLRDLAGRMAQAQGIRRPMIVMDFGTTRSSVAVTVDGTAQAVKLPGGVWDMPSVVAFAEDGSTMVGDAAKQMLSRQPERVVVSPKRLVGRRFRQRALESYLASLAVPVVEAPNGEVVLRPGEREVSVPEVCAPILRCLRRLAQQRLGQEVTQLVLTTPVSFDDRAREVLRMAAKIGGLQVAGFVDEPVAAALSNQAHPTFRDLVAVYDFGGGTFDFAVMRADGSDVEVVATAGDGWLGGDDFDEALATEAANAFWRVHRVELRRHIVQWQRLLAAAEEAKRQLTDHERTTIHLPAVLLTTRGPLDLVYPVTRAHFSREPLQGLIERSLQTCHEALEQANVQRSEINAVYLSGGTTWIPAVRDAVGKYFGQRPVCMVPPERAVLLGAAARACKLSS